MKELIVTRVNAKQASDSGMALVLILLILGFWIKSFIFFKIAIPVLIVNMIFPKLLSPFAVCWLSFANILGFFMSKVLLSAIYVILVIPTGIIRRLIGADAMKSKQFKKDRNSVFINKDHSFLFKDIENPY